MNLIFWPNYGANVTLNKEKNINVSKLLKLVPQHIWVNKTCARNENFSCQMRVDDRGMYGCLS